MRAALTIALGALLVWPSGALSATERRQLKPTSKWVLNYAEDSCRLARQFGDGDDQITLFLDQFGPGEWFRIMFLGKSLRSRSDTRPLRGTIRFGPHEAEADVAGLMGMTGDLPTFMVERAQRLAPLSAAEKAASEDAERRGMEFEPEPISAERERAATWLELRKAFRSDFVLETGRMDQPLAALRQCAWDTVKSWGLDVDQQKSLSRKPVAKPGIWIRSSDYPAAMIRGGYQGLVHYRIIVDENGKPVSCHIQASTRPKEFDDVVCRSAMKRAEFEPALDANGKPVRSYWRQTVQFRLED
jgi:TonB family protein